MSSMGYSLRQFRHPEVPAAGGPRRTTADVRFNSLAIYSASSAYLLPLPMGEREWGGGAAPRSHPPPPHPLPAGEREPHERASIEAICSRSAPSRRDRHLADVLRNFVTLLCRRALG